MIAEIKRRSPSKGPTCEPLDPATLAGEYDTVAQCLSVLTDQEFFGGSVATSKRPERNAAARHAQGLHGRPATSPTPG